MLTLRRKRAYTKRNSNKPRKTSKNVKLLSKLKTGTMGKILIGLGAAQVAGLVAGMVIPQYTSIVKPVAALAAGGVPAVAAELVLDQGILGNVMGIFNGGGINETRLAGGL